jgi:integrase
MDDMQTLPPGLKLVGSVYHLRIGIPKGITHLWPRLKNGKQATDAFRESLKTSDRAEAITLAHKLIAEHRAKFRALEDSAKPAPFVPLTPELEAYVAQAVSRRILEEDDHARLNPTMHAHGKYARRQGIRNVAPAPAGAWSDVGQHMTPEQLGHVAGINQAHRDALQLEVATGNTGRAKGYANRALTALNVRVDWDGPEGRAALQRIMRAVVRAWKGINERDQGEPVETPAKPEKPKSVEVSSVADDSAVYLEDIVTAWAKERKPSQQTIDIHDRAVERFHEYAGRHPVAKITKAHVVKFKDKMLEAGNTNVNTDSYLTNLRTLLNYAVANLKAEYNAADKIKVGERRNAKGARLPFDLPALKSIFASPVYTEGFRPERINWAPVAAYWFPLISLYSGARLEEIAQLSPDDIYEETYHDSDEQERTAWVIKLTDTGEDQGVKNEGSVRRFPVHPVLIERGLIELAQSRKGHKRIFAMTPDPRGREGANWGKWFGKYLRGACAVANERMTFHSFRHTFKDIARARSIPTDVHNAITGHSGEGVADTVYGGLTYPLGPLVDAMNRYRVLGLELPAKQ